MLISSTFLVQLQEHSGTAGSFLHQISNPACCCCYCLHFHRSLAYSRTATDTLATQKMHWAAGRPTFLLLIPAAAVWAWITSVLAITATALLPWGLLTHILSVCRASSCAHQCSAGRAGRDFYEIWFPQHSPTLSCTHTWNSTRGLDPKLCFTLSEESHSFQQSLHQTILCQWPK